ncbi:AtpZ/AtpI family protein [Streptomyces sp. NPDC057654]|uniref:AtpZ/AtpI family protein n=1 Tax=Streptomyces sp. NPDC057654 TaxID=3346196 RepID=UPI0036C30C26
MPHDERDHSDQPAQPEDHHDASPWWWGLGPLGAIVLVLLGIAAAAWSFFQLPGTADNPASGYYQASKVIAIGLVIAGTTLLGRLRSRTSPTGNAGERGDERHGERGEDRRA